MSITLNREYDFSQSEHLAQEIESTPHIRGRRITVRDIGALVHKRKLAPATIADRFELPEAAVHEALAFYHLNPEYFAQLEQSRRRQHEDAITPDDIAPDEPVDAADLGVENPSVTFDNGDDTPEPESDESGA
ncbi:DUF433 domain-containing protein [Natronomonas gomsonensis]|uniref:DUF433 domain-containing protein n=1 Tax=Natronomonas gomsonensis TaxID=1046043 RepID=UPI00227CC9C8|nr:DUF433 domain-containing protein [Natronomonas gomsonensis]MCY4732745.1 DUF433 domain-containing protein [Natronomonas gomsonensis]